MEELGIGRPSTYASTLSTLQDREYVKHRQAPLHSRGSRAGWSPAFLESFFERYVEYDFTADLEEKLDRISAGELDWKEVLREFWQDFSASVDEHQGPAGRQVLDTLNEELARSSSRRARTAPIRASARPAAKAN